MDLGRLVARIPRSAMTSAQTGQGSPQVHQPQNLFAATPHHPHFHLSHKVQEAHFTAQQSIFSQERPLITIEQSEAHLIILIHFTNNVVISRRKAAATAEEAGAEARATGRRV